MAISGYEAVYEDLLRSPEAQAALDSLRYWMVEAKVASYSFTVYADSESGMARTRTKWEVAFGPEPVRFSKDEYTEFRLSLDRALDGVDRRIIEENFGVKGRVGTRNCQKGTALRGRGGNKWGDGAVRSFGEALVEAAKKNAQLLALKEEAEARVVGEMISTSQTEEFARRRSEALCAAAADEVRAVLMKFREVPDDVLRRAAMGAAVEGVMDW